MSQFLEVHVDDILFITLILFIGFWGNLIGGALRWLFQGIFQRRSYQYIISEEGEVKKNKNIGRMIVVIVFVILLYNFL